MDYYKKYNLNKIKKDINNCEDKTIAIFNSDNINSNPIYTFNFSQAQILDLNYIPKHTFQNSTIIRGRQLFYYEVIPSKIKKQLEDTSLIQSIIDFISKFPQANKCHYFHGSALNSLILKFLFNKDIPYNDVNFIQIKDDLTNNSQEPKISKDLLLTSSFIHLGQKSINNVCIDYIETRNKKLDLKVFFNNQQINYSEVVFNINKSKLEFSNRYIDCLESKTIKLSQKNITLDSFLQSNRISILWDFNFYPNDYLYLFIDSIKNGMKKSELHFIPKDNKETKNIQIDSICPQKFEVMKKNIDFYRDNENIPWLNYSPCGDNLFFIDFNHCDFNLPYELLTKNEKYLKHFKLLCSSLKKDFSLSHTCLSTNMINQYFNYIEASCFDWHVKDDSFFTNFIYHWHKVQISPNHKEISYFLNRHSALKEKLFEMAKYRGIDAAWIFFKKLLEMSKKDKSYYFRFIGYLENHLSINIHKAPENEDIFSFIVKEFQISYKQKQDRFLRMPLFLPWYFKKMVKELKTSGELEEEGLYMHHCVAGYDSKVENHLCRIFHIETGMGNSTLEINEKFEIIQHKGFANNMPRTKNILLATLLVDYLKRKTNQQNKKPSGICSLLL